MSLEILGLGTATPEHGVSQVEAAELAKGFCCQTADQERLLAALYRRSGVRFRNSVLLSKSAGHEVVPETSSGSVDPRVVPPDQMAQAQQAIDLSGPATQSFYAPAISPADRGPTTDQRMAEYERHVLRLGLAAAEKALSDSRITGRELTHLVTISCTGFCAPGLDVRLLRALNCDPGTSRTHIGFMGCHGAINGLRVASAYAAADPDARILLCAVELCSLHQQYGWEPEQIVSNALFADGSAALVLAAAEQPPEGVFRRVVATGSTIVPDTEDLMSWRIRDHGFAMTLSARVPEMIRERLRPWLSEWLSGYGWAIEDIGSWAVHPGGPRILQAAAEAAGFAPAQLKVSQEILAECGNMSSPTVLFILQRLQQLGSPGPCVMLAFGPGLTIEAALID